MKNKQVRSQSASRPWNSARPSFYEHMQVITGLKSIPLFPKNTAVAIGNFDGVHLGHQKILQQLVREAKGLGLTSLVLTFFPHPEKTLGLAQTKMIQTLDQRLREVEKFGVDSALVLKFDKKLASLSSQQFTEQIIVSVLQAEAVVVGENFRFGKDRKGDLETLRRLAVQFKFSVCAVPSVVRNTRVVSSSLIRSLLQEAKIGAVISLLGRPYEVEGKVVKGKARGKSLGFPTANILPQNEILPPGVFITKSFVAGQDFPSLTNVGIRPTFGERKTQIESYLLNFNGDLYGQDICIQFLKKVRNEAKFKSGEELALQISRDLKKARAYFDSTRVS